MRHRPEHGFFLDLKNSLETAPIDTFGLSQSEQP